MNLSELLNGAVKVDASEEVKSLWRDTIKVIDNATQVGRQAIRMWSGTEKKWDGVSIQDNPLGFRDSDADEALAKGQPYDGRHINIRPTAHVNPTASLVVEENGEEYEFDLGGDFWVITGYGYGAGDPAVNVSVRLHNRHEWISLLRYLNERG